MLNLFAEVYIPEKERNNGKELHLGKELYERKDIPHKYDLQSKNRKQDEYKGINQERQSKNQDQHTKQKINTSIIAQNIEGENNFGWQIADKKLKYKRLVQAVKPTIPNSNQYEVLADEKEDIGNENGVAHVIAKDVEKQELEIEYGRLKNDAEKLKECFEVEKMTVRTLEEFLKKM